jgi:hypothetical protein
MNEASEQVSFFKIAMAEKDQPKLVGLSLTTRSIGGKISTSLILRPSVIDTLSLPASKKILLFAWKKNYNPVVT